jgi:hypothetical protein
MLWEKQRCQKGLANGHVNIVIIGYFNAQTGSDRTEYEGVIRCYAIRHGYKNGQVVDTGQLQNQYLDIMRIAVTWKGRAYLIMLWKII